jgi:DNA-binding NtrC family response regulator/CHASE2 domain-containing sensor protein
MTLPGRLFLTHRWVQAAVMSLAAVSMAWFLWTLAPAAFTTMERGWYDTWLKARRPPQTNPRLLLGVRDQQTEQVFGSGQWDRAVIARFVSGLQEAGAAAIGIDVPVNSPSPPTQGGAASDALLLEAVRSAGSVVYPDARSFEAQTAIASPSADVAHPQDIVQPASGHMLVTADRDRVARRIPLFAEAQNRTVPAFALQLAVMFEHIQPPDPDGRRQSLLKTENRGDDPAGTLRIPSDQDGNLLVNFVGQGSVHGFERVNLAELWKSLEQNADDQWEKRIKGHVVVLLVQPSADGSHQSPFGSELSGGLMQVHALDTILSRRWIHDVPPFPQFIIATLLCLGISWALLSRKAPQGVAVAIGGMVMYALIVLATLAYAQWVLPLTIPVTAGAFVILGASMLGQILSARRIALVEADMLRIQQELVSVREALVCRENAVDALEEDLVAARLTATSSASRQQELVQATDELRLSMAEARRLEDAARRRIEELERELNAARSAAASEAPLGDIEQEELRQECEQFGIITRHPSILGMFRDLKKVARSGVTVLITGEPGTGKELFARAVHRLSRRAAKPFIAVNMAAISPELFESELFGHIRGSFTGALADRKGYFELAHQGTIFLDEIGDLRLDHQSKLLRVLQDRTFYRVGATYSTTVDVRIVAATNKDLQRGVSEGWFREDLYFRLKGLILHLPPLRDRAEDIPALAQACLREVSRQLSRAPIELSENALAVMIQQSWKGNVRELRHCLERAAALCEGPIIGTVDLRLEEPSLPSTPIPESGPEGLPDSAGDAAVLNLLRRHTFDMQATAKALGWDRSTVTQRLKGLCFQALVESGGDRSKAASALAGDPALLRRVELKLMDYYGHLMETIGPFAAAEDALLDCKRRFKNLPERHFKSLELLVRKHFDEKAGKVAISVKG